MDSRYRIRIGMMLLLAGIGPTMSGCDNGKLDSEAGLRLFSGKKKAVGPAYTLPEDTSPADQRTEDHDLFIHDESDGAVADVCTPDCADKECGSDGCESTCGTCGVGTSCQVGKCEVKCGDGQCGGDEDKCNCPGDCTGGCAGCCAGTVCKAGTSNGECGKEGAACAACSGGETCQSQACQHKCGDLSCGGTETCANCPKDCGECPECTADSDCDAFEDGDVCNGTLFCDKLSNPWSCAIDAGSVVVCPDPEGPNAACQLAVCDPGTGSCSMVAVTDGEPCPGPSVCWLGVCAPVAWTDPVSGLTWQVTPTGGTMKWSDAKAHCAGLTLDGGGWHLPTIGELRTLIRGCPGTVTGGACEVTDSCLSSSCQNEACNGCSGNNGPAGGCYWPDEMQGTCGWYWSSSPVEDLGGYAWLVYFYYGGVASGLGVYSDFGVRCVR